MTGLVADAALAGALAVHVELLQRLRLVDEAHPPWWLGYARDGANLAAALMLWGAYLMLGFAPAVAICAAMLTTLAVYLADWTIARALHARHVRLLLAAPLAAWIAYLALAPSGLGRALTELIAATQPR